MADNYLEKKMEEHARGVVKRVTALTVKGTVRLPIPSRRIFIDVADVCAAPYSQIVRAFAEAGCRVAFCGSDNTAGNRAAQALGARFLPFDPARAVARAARTWGGLDMYIAGSGATAFDAFAGLAAEGAVALFIDTDALPAPRHIKAFAVRCDYVYTAVFAALRVPDAFEKQ